ncbi:MAG: hypothetical protein ACLFPX_03795 [Candidatus Omnitrophota bacterium]
MIMRTHAGIWGIGIIEICIGGVTLLSNYGAMITGVNDKPGNVLFFVLASATVSLLIGIGILRKERSAYRLLLYFSSVVILSKVLILMDIIRLNGALLTAVPNDTRSLISILYHAGVIIYLLRPGVKNAFGVSTAIK